MKKYIALLCVIAVLCGLMCACVDDGSLNMPNTDSVEDVAKIDTPLGAVQITPALREELRWHSDSAEFQVCISVHSMVPDNYLDTLLYEGVSASEYLARSIELEGVDEETSYRYRRIFLSLRREYFSELLEGLSYSGKKDGRAEICQEYLFFYTTMTKSEILNLTCDSDEAFCVFATAMYK